MEVSDFFQKLKPGDWEKQVNSTWRVKDVLAHLVGWEREIAQEFKRTWETSEKPWFAENENYDDFNRRILEEFRDFSPIELLRILKHWEDINSAQIQKIGEAHIRQEPETASWLFDEGTEPHFEHHLKQVQKALRKNG